MAPQPAGRGNLWTGGGSRVEKLSSCFERAFEPTDTGLPKQSRHASQRLGRKALDEVAQIVRPETILAWLRKLVARKLDGSKNRSSDGRLPYCCFSGRTEEKTPQSLNEAEQLAAGKPEILQRASEARETLEPPKK